MFSKGMLSVINKPTRVSKHSMTCIDHIYTNSFINQELFTGIIKTDLSESFSCLYYRQKCGSYELSR